MSARSGGDVADEGGMRALGRRKVKARQASNHLPEPFFRKRSTEVIRAKPRLDMCDRNSVVECGPRPLKCALRVPLHHDGRPSLASHDYVQLLPAAG